MSHTIKLEERVIEIYRRICTSIINNQFEFMLGRTTIEAIHVMKQMIEYYRARKIDLHMVFIDLEKA